LAWLGILSFEVLFSFFVKSKILILNSSLDKSKQGMGYQDNVGFADSRSAFPEEDNLATSIIVLHPRQQNCE